MYISFSGRKEAKQELNIVLLEVGNLGKDMKFDRFSELGNVTIYQQTPLELLPERIAEADVVVTNNLPMNESTLKDAKCVKYIGVTATGTNSIDFAYVNSRGIRVTNVAGYSTDAVAQHTFALLLYLLEHLRYYDDYVRSGAYTKSPSFCHMDRSFTELQGKTWGIIGLGVIGRKVAEIARVFGCEVIYYSASGNRQEVPYEQVDLDTLLKRSDIVSVHAPLSEKTRHIMNYEAFCKMKRSAVFLNVARGPIVEEHGLCRALKENRIAAAGLDVLEAEPMGEDSPLRELAGDDRLLITPHIAWAPVETRTRLLDEVWKNIEAFINGEERNVCTG